MYKAYKGINISEEHDELYLGTCEYNTFIILCNCIPFTITLLFPQVAVVLGFIGSLVGLLVIYIMPVLTYLKKLKSECDNLQVSEANQIYLDSLNKRLYGHDSSLNSSFDNSFNITNKMFNCVINDNGENNIK